MAEKKLVNGKLFITKQRELDLERSCFCGQAFRWSTDGQNTYSCVLGDTLVYVYKDEDLLVISPCENDEQAELFSAYFNVDCGDYSDVEQRMLDDDVLKDCVPYGHGIRLFSQEPFETLISFIISANNNIKRICSTIDKLCKARGKRRFFEGVKYFTFPSPSDIADMTIAELEAIGTGYRAPYIKNTAAKIASGEFDLSALRHMPYREAKKAIQALPGVGPKVADCVLLFSLDHGCAFPADVWIKRAMAKMYFLDKTPSKAEFDSIVDSFGDDAGIIQQYIFNYARETGLKTDASEDSAKILPRTYGLDVLSEIARESICRLNASGITNVAIAARGTESDLIVINAATEAFGADNVLVLTADTGCVAERDFSLVAKACEYSDVKCAIVHVDVDDLPGADDKTINGDELTKSAEYKRAIFLELTHEAWIRGFSVMLDGCTDDNCFINGNEQQHALGVISPLAQCLQ